MPVTLPPGRESLAINPRCTASASAGVTIGIVVVACLCRNGRAAGRSQDHAGIEAHELFGKRRQPVDISVREPVRDVELAAFGIALVPHALQESIDENPGGCGRAHGKPRDERPLGRRLRARRERPKNW